MMQVKTRIIFILFILLPYISYAQNRDRALDYYDEAMGLMDRLIDEPNKEAVYQVIELHKKSIEADTKFIIGYEQLASDYWSIGETEEGMRYINLGIERNGASATLYLIKGFFLEDLQKFDEAKSCYRKAQLLFKKSFKPRKMTFDEVLYYAITYYLLENQDAAIAKFKALADAGAFSEADYDWFYPLGIDTLTNVDIIDFINQAILNKYQLR